VKIVAIKIIKFYQRYLTKYTPDCIYEPSCSEYCILAIEKYGLFRGIKKFKERINRCDMAHIHCYGSKDYP
jgi:uncharacterized protein